MYSLEGAAQAGTGLKAGKNLVWHVFREYGRVTMRWPAVVLEPGDKTVYSQLAKDAHFSMGPSGNALRCVLERALVCFLGLP